LPLCCWCPSLFPSKRKQPAAARQQRGDGLFLIPVYAQALRIPRDRLSLAEIDTIRKTSCFILSRYCKSFSALKIRDRTNHERLEKHEKLAAVFSCLSRFFVVPCLLRA
jgi:hypothetical protein